MVVMVRWVSERLEPGGVACESRRGCPVEIHSDLVWRVCCLLRGCHTLGCGARMPVLGRFVTGMLGSE